MIYLLLMIEIINDVVVVVVMIEIFGKSHGLSNKYGWELKKKMRLPTRLLHSGNKCYNNYGTNFLWKKAMELGSWYV